jgi:hypothetical protein
MAVGHRLLDKGAPGEPGAAYHQKLH